MNSLPNTWHMPQRSHIPWCHHRNDNWRAIQVIHILIMQFYPTSCYFLPIRPKHLNYSLGIFFPFKCDRKRSCLLWGSWTINNWQKRQYLHPSPCLEGRKKKPSRITVTTLLKLVPTVIVWIATWASLCCNMVQITILGRTLRDVSFTLSPGCTGCFNYRVPEHGNSHDMSRRMQDFYEMKLLCLGTR